MARHTAYGIILTLFLAGMLTLVRASSGANIDVYTQRGGQGPHEPSGAFSPEDEVILTAFVTYSGWPRQFIFVVFTINHPTGHYMTLQAITGADGIASKSFKIPSAEHPGFDVFGTWSVSASASVAGKLCKDTLTFEVHTSIRPAIPEVPLGTIVASAAMIISLVAYITTPRWRRKLQSF